MSLRSFLLKRFAYTIVLVFFVIVLNWIIFEAMPGLQGTFYTVLGNPNRGLNTVEYNKLVQDYGLNQPPLVRFVDYVKAMLTFNFGYSYNSGQPVAFEMINTGRLWNTIELIGTSTILSIVIGILLGIVAARKRGSAFDSVSVSSSLVAFSLPTFWLGFIFIIIFAEGLGWFPAGLIQPNSWAIGGQMPTNILVVALVRLQHLFLPALVLTLITYGGFLLLTRATMLEALTEDYITTARAKGLPERRVLLHHAFKNASLPIITASALSFGGLLGGAIITETVFNWAGLGKWLYDAIQFKDYPVMQGMFFILALSVIIANFLSDIIYGMVDPRIKYE
jgi:peptide/nickel transport system permease protein